MDYACHHTCGGRRWPILLASTSILLTLVNMLPNLDMRDQLIQALQSSNGCPLASSQQPSFAHCDFTIDNVDVLCPRFVNVRYLPNAGLGDRFLQYLVGLTYALRLDALLVSPNEHWHGDSPHGNYSWAPEFFLFNLGDVNQTSKAMVEERFPGLTHVEHPFNLSSNFEERIRLLKAKCNLFLHVDFADCVENSCYYATDPRLYEETRHVLGCWFMHTDRLGLPALLYDYRWYNVFVHIRVGDATLYDERKGGMAFFTGLKEQLGEVLADLFPVHYYFFAEAPSNGTTNHRTPPPGFEFLSSIFEAEASVQTKRAAVGHDQEDETHYLQRVSFVNDMDVKATIYHEMNADMVITTGSSFPLIGVTVSPKPIVLFSRAKEGQHFPVYLRQDYAIVENDGTIVRPTVSQLKAQVITRYAEVHHRVVPYR